MSVLKLQNLAILVVAGGVSVAAGEGALRVALDEVDYLRPTLAADPILGHIVRPGSAGHDDWGFRNTDVPENVSILAVGDSQTYGFSATRTQSWPAQLADLSGEATYNLAQGGYGPLDYAVLVEQKAALLNPEVIIVGFYFGNDLLEKPEVSTLLNPQDDTGRAFSGVRDWLSRNSLTYQLLKLQGGALIGRLRFEESVANLTYGSYVLEADGLRTVLTPDLRLKNLDQSDDSIRRGIARAFESLRSIEGVCETLESRCIVTLIPTKESVYWPVARTALTGDGLALTEKMVEAEQTARMQLIGFLEDNEFEYIDVLPSMQQAAQQQNIYPNSHDGHPTGAGYQVIAEATWQYLTETGAQASAAQ